MHLAETLDGQAHGRRMTASSQRILATLLLASYGLISACGNGLHAWAEGSHGSPESSCSSEPHHSTPETPPPDHSDCLICHVAGQGQLSCPSLPVISTPAEIGEVIALPPLRISEPDRLIGAPRAPPRSLA
jgi:hypothetical protein